MSAATQQRCIRRDSTTWTTCSCPPCVVVRARMNKIQASGRYRRVPSEVALTRVERWFDAGYDTSWVASAAGVPRRFVESLRVGLRAGHRRNIGALRSRQIMEARIDSASTGRRRATGTTRRLQALAFLGYRLEDITAGTGVPEMCVSKLMRGEQATVLAGPWRAIRDYYDRVGLEFGPSRTPHLKALRRGWVGPLAWDDDVIEDPSARPQTGVEDEPAARVGRPSTATAQDTDEYLQLHPTATAHEVGRQLNLKAASVYKALRRVGRQDLVDQLIRNAELVAPNKRRTA